MRTAIFVYQTTNLQISTSEPDLELCGMTTPTVALSGGQMTLPVTPGVYKIDSCHQVCVTGEPSSVFETVSATKTNEPKPPPRAISFGAAMMHDFLSTPDAKQIATP